MTTVTVEIDHKLTFGLIYFPNKFGGSVEKIFFNLPIDYLI